MVEKILIEYIVAVRKSEKSMNKLTDILPGFVEVIEDLSNDRLLWEDKVIYFLLNDNTESVDYFFESVYNPSSFISTEDIVNKALYLSKS